MLPAKKNIFRSSTGIIRGMARPHNHQLVEKLHSIARVIEQRGDYVLCSEMDIGYSQYIILSTLFTQPNCSQADVAQHLHVSPPAISRQVEMMLSKGLITSHKNPLNKRQHVLSLTCAGGNRLNKAKQVLNKKFGEIVTTLNVSDKQQLARILDL